MPAVLNAATWRKHPYSFRGYLWVDDPPVVFQCQVNGTVLFPVADLPYDGVTVGAYTDCYAHATVLFGSTAGADDLGRGRLRKVPTSNTLYIGRSSQGTEDGTCNLSDNSWITVLDEFRPWARVPYIADGSTIVNGTVPALTTQFRDWDLDYTVGINGPPVVNLGFGPGIAKYVDPNTNVLSFSFDALLISKTYDTGTFASWLWNVKDGTITAGSTTNPIITVTFPPGRRYIHLTGTDLNGNATTRHLLVVACKDGTAYEPFKVFDVQDQRTELNGANNTFNVRIWSDMPRATYPDGMMVIYFEDEWYGSTAGPVNVVSDVLGQTGAEGVKFCGWHYNDTDTTTASEKATLSEVTLNCLDICGWLDKRPGFSMEVNRKASPTSWLEQKNASMDKYFLYILYFCSTALFLSDYYDTNTGDEYGFSRLGSGQKSLYQQVDELADRAMGYCFTANEQGMMFIRPNQSLLATANRTSTTIIALTQADLDSIRYTFTRPSRTHWNRGAAIVVTTVDVDQLTTVPTAFAVAPGSSPAQGPSETDHNEQLVTSAVELYTRTGNRNAEENANFGDLELSLIHTGDAGIDPAYGQWIKLTVSSTYAAQRGLTFTNTRLRVISTSTARQCTEKGNIKTIKIVGRAETSGSAAIDDTPATSIVADAPPAAPPQILTDPTGWGNISGFRPTRLLVAGGSKVLYFTSVYGTPVKLDITPSIAMQAILNGNAFAITDPYDYNRLVLAGEGGIATLSGYQTATPYPSAPWSLPYQPPTDYPLLFPSVRGTIVRQGYFGWLEKGTGAHAGQDCYVYTTDDFVTTHRTVLGCYQIDKSDVILSCFDGIVFIAGVNAGFPDCVPLSDKCVLISTDWGATFNILTGVGTVFRENASGPVMTAYCGPDGREDRSNQYVWWSKQRGESLIFNKAGVISTTSAPDNEVTSPMHNINAFTLNCRYRNFADDGVFYRSLDNGVTWGHQNLPFAIGNLNGWPTNPNWLCVGGTAAVAVTFDGGLSSDSWMTLPLDLTGADAGVQVMADLTEIYSATGVHP